MDNRGSILIMTLALVLVLVGLVSGFLYAAGTFTLNSGWEETDMRALWLAEAGLDKAIWSLMTPVASGGQGETWTTAGTTENLGSGSYTMVVDRWDFALAANNATASDSPAQTNSAVGPAKAIDGDDTTYWESKNKPSSGNPQAIIIAFPYTLTVNKVRFLVPSGSSNQAPTDYTWAVSTDGSTYTTVVTVTSGGGGDGDSGSGASDVTSTFSAQSNVNYLKLTVTGVGGGSIGTRIATLEAIGARVTSTGTVNSISRTVRQTAVADDGSPQNQVSYNEPDWSEL